MGLPGKRNPGIPVKANAVRNLIPASNNYGIRTPNFNYHRYPVNYRRASVAVFTQTWIVQITG